MHPQTHRIFELLSKGQFICSNSTNDEQRRLHSILEEDYESFQDYFSAIGYELEKGDEFFYFSRKESRADLERKIEQAYKWIDIVDFFKAYNSGFGVGFCFMPSEVMTQVKVDANLRDKLDQMKKSLADGTLKEKVQRLIDELVKNGFMEVESDIIDQYKVLSSYAYIETLLLSIHITEETEDALSK